MVVCEQSKQTALRWFELTNKKTTHLELMICGNVYANLLERKRGLEIHLLHSEKLGGLQNGSMTILKCLGFNFSKLYIGAKLYCVVTRATRCRFLTDGHILTKHLVAILN